MRDRFVRSMSVVVALAFLLLSTASVTHTTNVTHTNGAELQPALAQNAAPQTPSAAAPSTAWGEPDLQGLWSVELLVPLERPAGVTNEFYSDEQVAQLDQERSITSVFGNHVRAPQGTEADVAGAYNSVFTSQRPTGRRTGMIIDPPDGKIPAFTQEADVRRAAMREYEMALMQNTAVCRDAQPGCRGGTYGPPSPRREELAPSYVTRNINRANGPEDRSLGERCMSGNVPQFGGGFTGIHYRVVQSPGVVTIFYDVGQGQGFNRVIQISDAPHLPPHVQQWWGDSRGRWEGNTLVVDVTNFTPKRDFQGSRENLHLVERWTRTGPDTLEVVSTMADPTVWTRPWTVVQDFKIQDNQANRIYYEPRCHEGNYGLPGVFVGARTEEQAFAEGRGPDPATKCIASCSSSEGRDPLALR